MRKILSSHSMKRRDFFSTLAQAGMEVLGQNAFHGTLQEHAYTFIPSHMKDKPTLLVVGGLRLKEKLYLNSHNVIFMKDWPRGVDVTFWRKLLLRHDLTDQMHVLCLHMPTTAPSFFKRIICLSAGSAKMASTITRRVPTLVMVSEDQAFNLPDNVETWATGSDVFVGQLNSLNNVQGPAKERLSTFLG